MSGIGWNADAADFCGSFFLTTKTRSSRREFCFLQREPSSLRKVWSFLGWLFFLCELYTYMILKSYQISAIFEFLLLYKQEERFQKNCMVEKMLVKLTTIKYF